MVIVVESIEVLLSLYKYALYDKSGIVVLPTKLNSPDESLIGLSYIIPALLGPILNLYLLLSFKIKKDLSDFPDKEPRSIKLFVTLESKPFMKPSILFSIIK